MPSPKQTVILDDISQAADLLRLGKLVAFPTETVYGLGGAIWYPETISDIFRAKGRPADNPLIVHVADAEALHELTPSVPTIARELVQAFWPGPLTIVVPKREAISSLISAGLDSVAVRSPKSELARSILKECRIPIAAPSANRSGKPSATTWQAVLEDLEGWIDAVMKGPPCEIGLESTVVDCTSKYPRLLRAGSVTPEQLAVVCPEIEMSGVLSTTANSPGLRHRHYQPVAKVIPTQEVQSVSPSSTRALLTLDSHPSAELFGLYRLCQTPEDYAAVLFEFFRQADRQGITEIFCQLMPASGIGRAIRDRLHRAADSQ
jgi:L-threonylcarbamoyladenylate synthase